MEGRLETIENGLKMDGRIDQFHSLIEELDLKATAARVFETVDSLESELDADRRRRRQHLDDVGRAAAKVEDAAEARVLQRFERSLKVIGEKVDATVAHHSDALQRWKAGDEATTDGADSHRAATAVEERRDALQISYGAVDGCDGPDEPVCSGASRGDGRPFAQNA